MEFYTSLVMRQPEFASGSQDWQSRILLHVLLPRTKMAGKDGFEPPSKVHLAFVLSIRRPPH